MRQFEFNPIVEPHKRKGYFHEKQVDFDFFEAFEDAGDPESKSQTAVLPNEAARKRRPGGSALSSSVWNCDGEVLSEAAIQAKVHCQLVTIYATGCDVERLLGQRPTKVRFQ